MSEKNNDISTFLGFIIAAVILITVIGVILDGPAEWGSHPIRTIKTGNNYDKYENIDPELQDALEKAANKRGQSIY